MNSPVVSIILPIYNVEKYLEKCLNCIVYQTYKNLEIVCVYDTSSDNSLAILRKFEKLDSRIKVVIRKEKSGLSAARNTGMENASGDYFYFMDTDDWIDNDYIEKMLFAALESQSPVVVNTNVVMHREGREPAMYSPAIAYPNIRDTYISSEKAILNIIWNTWAYLWKKELLEKIDVKFPVGYYAEDIFFQAAVLAYVDKVYVTRDSSYHYMIREDSLSGMLKSDEIFSVIEDYKLFNRIVDFFKSRDLYDTIRAKLFWGRVPSFENNNKRAAFEVMHEYFQRIQDNVKRNRDLYNEFELKLFDDVLNNFEKAVDTNYKKLYSLYLCKNKDIIACLKNSVKRRKLQNV